MLQCGCTVVTNRRCARLRTRPALACAQFQTKGLVPPHALGPARLHSRGLHSQPDRVEHVSHRKVQHATDARPRSSGRRGQAIAATSARRPARLKNAIPSSCTTLHRGSLGGRSTSRGSWQASSRGGAAVVLFSPATPKACSMSGPAPSTVSARALATCATMRGHQASVSPMRRRDAFYHTTASSARAVPPLDATRGRTSLSWSSGRQRSVVLRWSRSSASFATRGSCAGSAAMTWGPSPTWLCPIISCCATRSKLWPVAPSSADCPPAAHGHPACETASVCAQADARLPPRSDSSPRWHHRRLAALLSSRCWRWVVEHGAWGRVVEVAYRAGDGCRVKSCCDHLRRFDVT